MAILFLVGFLDFRYRVGLLEKVFQLVVFGSPAAMAFFIFMNYETLYATTQSADFLDGAMCILMAFIGRRIYKENIHVESILGKLCFIFPYITGAGGTLLVASTYNVANQGTLLYTIAYIAMFVAVGMGIYALVESHTIMTKWKRRNGR